MPAIVSVAEAIPEHVLTQDQVMDFARDLFSESFKDIERLLKAFRNGQIEKRHFAKGLDWFKTDKSFEDRNNAYIEQAIELGTKAIKCCLENDIFLSKNLNAMKSMPFLLFQVQELPHRALKQES